MDLQARRNCIISGGKDKACGVGVYKKRGDGDRVIQG
jgi:hypothetical protein